MNNAILLLYNFSSVSAPILKRLEQVLLFAEEYFLSFKYFIKAGRTFRRKVPFLSNVHNLSYLLYFLFFLFIATIFPSDYSQLKRDNLKYGKIDIFFTNFILKHLIFISVQPGGAPSPQIGDS